MIQSVYQASMYMQNYMAPAYPIYMQIRSIITSLQTKKNIKNAKQDLLQLINRIGPDAQRFAITKVVETIESKEYRDKPQNNLKILLLTDLIKEYANGEAFLSYFPEVVTSAFTDVNSNAINSEPQKYGQLFSNIIMATKLPITTQITLALSIYLHDLKELSQVGQIELERKLKEFKALNKRPAQLPERVLDELLFQFSQNISLQQRLQEEYQFLLEGAEGEKIPCARLLNYLNDQWHYFATQQPIVQKSPVITIRKCDLLRDLGPPATASPETIKLVFSDLGTINEDQAFECLMIMGEERINVDVGVQKFVTDLLVANKRNLKSQQLRKIFAGEGKKGQAQAWNIDSFIAYCQQTANFKWPNVMLQIDRPKLQFKSQEHFVSFMRIVERIRKQVNKFKVPQSFFFKKWNNPYSQAIFLLHVMKCKEPEVLGLTEFPNRRIQKTVKDGNNVVKQMWGHLDLLQLLVEVSEHHYLPIRQLFDLPISKYPELLIQSLAEIRPIKGQPLLDEIFSQIFPNYLHNHSNNIRLLQTLWESNQDLVISCICQLYKSQSKKQNSLNLSRVLDIAQVIKESLIPLTNWNDYEFAVPLAILAGKRQFLHFEPWITDRIKNAGNPFLKAILAYIQDHLLTPIRKYIETNQHFSCEIVLEKAQLSKQLLAFIFESIFLTTSSSKMTKRNLQSLKRIYKQVCTYFPEMSESQMPDEIEQLAERQFVKIYKKDITIDQAIEQMRKLKNSTKVEEKQLFASMITFMYSQLRFHISYPENELFITADLFAGIVNNNLIDKKLIQVLLQVLQDDLKEDNKKYLFAKAVIEKIKGKLVMEGDFCEKLLEIPFLLQKDPQLVQMLIKAVEPPIRLSVQREKRLKQAIKIKNSPPEPMILVPGGDQDGFEQKKAQNTDYDILSQLDRSKQISTFLGEKDNRLTKINTICNTLSLSNIDEKAKDLQKIIDCKTGTSLLAYNIVFKRIPLVAHTNSGIQIFYRLVQKLPKIESPVRRLTYKILEAWFGLVDKSVNDRKLSNFKSLAFWLGKLTLSKGMPIQINKINIREILVNSYTHYLQRLPLNVSVILKILEHVTTFKDIFKVSNPWMGRILGTLNEIQQKLKEEHTNTKTQVKAFFININVKKGRELNDHSLLPPDEPPIISKLPQYVAVRNQIQSYYKGKGIDLKMIIAKAVDDSIQEIVQPVIDRAVKIAIVTAKQLIFKDFAMESNPDRFKNSFSNVVKKLAGPLAQVTSREPLKNSMTKILKTILAQQLSNTGEVDDIINKIVPDNLDLGCALIKKAVIESAEQAIRKDESIKIALDQRSTCAIDNKQFRDEAFLREIPEIVPEQLRPKAGGLSLEQFLIYDEFRKERKVSQENVQFVSNADHLWQIFSQRGPVKSIKQLLQTQPGLKDELMNKVFVALRDCKEEVELQYQIEVCEVLKQFVEPQEAWSLFKEKADISKKEVSNLVRRLVRERFFQDSCLSELKYGNQQEQKAINMFQKWLDTAREQIQPFLQNLEEIFNKSQNQIRTFFEYSLNYALQKVEASQSPYHISIDTTYIEDYSKLIIISYKLIASNNSNIFLEHTLQAILQVFNRSFGKDSKDSHQRAFFKLFLNLICDATRKQYDFHRQKVTSFYYILAKELHKINPTLYPNFSFAWTQLISNKYFMPALLQKYEYWDVYFELICDLFRFSKDNLIQEGLNDHQPSQVFYKGIMRIIIILIHDFPDFLSAFSLQLVLIIPDKYIQIKNIVLSAYPKQLKFRSPKAIFSRQQLQKQSNIMNIPKYYKLKFDKAKYNQFISLFQNNDKSLKSKLESENDQALQIFVLYFAWLQQCQLSVTNSRKLLMDIVIGLQGDLKEKMIKYALNLVRFPNFITCFFIDFITTIVFKSNSEKTRNLLLSKMFERINVESAHPWGMLYLVSQFQTQKNELTKLQIPKDILSRL